MSSDTIPIPPENKLDITIEPRGDRKYLVVRRKGTKLIDRPVFGYELALFRELEDADAEIARLRKIVKRGRKES